MMAPRDLYHTCLGSARGAWRALGFCLPVLGLCGAVDAQVISGADFAGPTSQYPHAVLGDALEWSELRITVAGSGVTHSLPAPEGSVYEDLVPRLWDVTGDGQPEVVVVNSDQSLGARLVIYGLDDAGVPTELATTDHIGTRFRWLAPVGAQDFDGDGHIEIAYVDRPHLAKTLRVWRFIDGGLTAVAHLRGVSNHKIGEDFISGGVRDCGNGPEMVLADANWRTLVAVRLTSDEITGERIAPFQGPKSFEAALACQ